jgi:hypothetical protein
MAKFASQMTKTTSCIFSPSTVVLRIHQEGQDAKCLLSGTLVRPLNLEPRSEQAIEFMRRRLQRCRRKHAQCGEWRETLHSLKMPARLIDVGLTGDSQVSIRAMGEEVKSYAALTYCWGDNQAVVKTTKANLQERLSSILLKILPNSIKDAIEVTRRLGLRYIWVDALCIVQDDDKEQMRELGKMSEIYKGAFITISAARAARSNEGFLQGRDVRDTYGATFELPVRRIREGVESRSSIILSEGADHNDREEPIDSRAWTFQEHQQALRLLRFGSKQVEWKCPQTHRVDGGSIHYSDLDPKYFTGSPYGKHSGLEEEGMLSNWMMIVEHYSSRGILRLRDRLPAFAAVAENFAHAMGWQSSDYWAGLWKSDILMQLQWHRPEVQGPTVSNSEQSCPSWSWTSVRGRVEYGMRLKWNHDTLEIIECNIELKSPDCAYCEVISGCLIVKGYFREAKWTGHSFMNVSSDDVSNLKIILPIKAYWDVPNTKTLQSVWCLEINAGLLNSRKSCGLLLTLLDTNTFKRVGYFELDHPRQALGKRKRLDSTGSRALSKASLDLNWLHKCEPRVINIL